MVRYTEGNPVHDVVDSLAGETRVKYGFSCGFVSKVVSVHILGVSVPCGVSAQLMRV